MIFFAILLFLLPNDTLELGSFDLPPYVISSGNYKGKGMFENSLYNINKILSSIYKIEENILPFTRLLNNFKNKENFCATSIFKTPEREKYAYFSPFHSIVSSYVLITKEGLLGQSLTSVSLIKIINDNKYVIGIEQSRSFSILDKIIKEGLEKNPTSFFKRPGVGANNALYKMLHSNRIQIVLALKGEIILQQRLHSEKNKTKLSFYNIKENTIKYGPIHFACSKTKKGKEAIEAISKIIISKDFNRKKQSLIGASYWLDKDLLEEYSKNYDEEMSKE